VSTIKLTMGDLSITIEGKSDDFFHQDLYTNAIVTLIEEADVSGWIKHHDDFDISQNFNISVLKALIRNNAIEWDYPDDLSYKNALIQIIDDLKNDPQLEENIVFLEKD